MNPTVASLTRRVCKSQIHSSVSLFGDFDLSHVTKMRSGRRHIVTSWDTCEVCCVLCGAGLESLPRTMIRVSPPDSCRSTAPVLMGVDRTLGRQSRTKRRTLTAVQAVKMLEPVSLHVWFGL